MRKSFTAYQIKEAFRQLRESIAFGTDIDFANGSNFTVREIEGMLLDILQPPAVSVVKQKAMLNKLESASLDDFNDALFG